MAPPWMLNDMALPTLFPCAALGYRDGPSPNVVVVLHGAGSDGYAGYAVHQPARQRRHAIHRSCAARTMWRSEKQIEKILPLRDTASVTCCSCAALVTPGLSTSTSLAFQIDIRCALQPVVHAVTIGPTRHAGFNARVGPGMSRLHGGQISYRASDSAQPQQESAIWTSYCGPVGGGHRSGIALAPRMPVETPSWYVSDWGVMTANPCRDRAITVCPGEAPAQLGARFLVFDGSLNDDALDALLTA